VEKSTKNAKGEERGNASQRTRSRTSVPAKSLQTEESEASQAASHSRHSRVGDSGNNLNAQKKSISGDSPILNFPPRGQSKSGRGNEQTRHKA
jgi:hypothetical protein